MECLAAPGVSFRLQRQASLKRTMTEDDPSQAPACAVCNSPDTRPFRPRSFLFGTSSYRPDLHTYDNRICAGCGVVFGHPAIPEEKLREYYTSEYWSMINVEGVAFGETTITAPLDFRNSRTGLLRSGSFYEMISRNPAARPSRDDLVIDYGAYQGLFLYALREYFGCRGLAYDYNVDGLAFAENQLGLETRLVEDAYTDDFPERADMVTMVHFLEHIPNPVALLTQIRRNVLKEAGALYIEVPNLTGHPISDPFHPFTYSRDSLAYLLARCGFSLTDIEESTLPYSGAQAWHNDAQNLVALASADLTPGEVPPPGVDTGAVSRNVQRSFTSCSRRGLARSARAWLRDGARLVYHGTFVALESVSPSAMMAIARGLGLRKDP